MQNTSQHNIVAMQCNAKNEGESYFLKKIKVFLDSGNYSGVDAALMEEWGQLVKREYELDVAMESIVNAVYEVSESVQMERYIYLIK